MLHQSSILRTSSQLSLHVNFGFRNFCVFIGLKNSYTTYTSYLVPLFKRVLVENLSDRYNMNLRENELIGATYFHINVFFFTPRLVLKQRQDATLKWPSLLTCRLCLAAVIFLSYDTWHIFLWSVTACFVLFAHFPTPRWRALKAHKRP